MNAHHQSRGLVCVALLGGFLTGCNPGTGTTNSVPTAPPTSRFVYVAGQIGGVFAYKIDDTSGSLSSVSNSPFGAGTSDDVAVDPSSRFAYSADCLLHTVTAFKLDSTTGALVPQLGKSTPVGAAGNCPVALAVHPSGRFLYVLASGFVAGTEPTNPGALTVFAIDAITGQLTPISGGSLTIGIGNLAGRLALDGPGNFLYATEGLGISAFTINQSTGLFTSVPGSPFAAANQPFGLALNQLGKFLYATNSLPGDLSTFSIDASSGKLTELSRTSVGNSNILFSVAIEPKAHFLYVTDNSLNEISAFTIDPVGAPLLSVPGSPFAAGSGPNWLAVDPSGKFLYVSNQNSNTISAFIINDDTGGLTAVTGSPFPQSGGPAGIAFAVH